MDQLSHTCSGRGLDRTNHPGQTHEFKAKIPANGQRTFLTKEAKGKRYQVEPFTSAPDQIQIDSYQH